MKLLLTHGYFIAEDPKEQEIMRPYPPLGILYVSAWLNRVGYQHEIFDSTFSSLEKLFQKLESDQPEVVAFYTNLMTRINVLKVISFIRNHDQLKNTTIILGGPEVRYNAEGLLQNGADYLVVGEGEQTMEALLNALPNGRAEATQVDGIAWLTPEGEVQFNKERTKLRSIDDLPIPNRAGIDLSLYLNAWKERHGENAVSISTMRGCPYTCKWCSRAVYGLSYRRRSPELVVDELEELCKTYQPDTFWFVDDVFTVSHKWLAAFTAEVQKRNLKIRYECISRADRMSDEVIALLKASGCFRVWIGAESGSQKIIDKMDRRVSVEQVREMIRATRRAGMQAGTFIMLGYPGETEADIEETIHHLKASSPDQFTITVAYPIKGTELFEEVQSLQTHEIDFMNQNDRDRDFERTYNRRYYDFAVRRVVNEVRHYQEKNERGGSISKRFPLKLRSVAAKMGMWMERQRS